MKKDETKQTTLFGGYVEETENEQTLVFVKVHEEVVSEGDQFTLTPNNVIYNETKNCMTMIDSEKNQALTVWFENHPNAKYQSMPDGIRLGRAVEKVMKINLATAQDLEDCMTDTKFELNITHTGDKGRLWTVKQV